MALSPNSEPLDVATTQLTARERQVLAHIAVGKTSKEIATALGIGLRTVNCHRENLARKLGTSSVAALTRYAIFNGIRDID
jgi:DNA-binding CsgD family transcriptional regulator